MQGRQYDNGFHEWGGWWGYLSLWNDSGYGIMPEGSFWRPEQRILIYLMSLCSFSTSPCPRVKFSGCNERRGT